MIYLRIIRLFAITIIFFCCTDVTHNLCFGKTQYQETSAKLAPLYTDIVSKSKIILQFMYQNKTYSDNLSSIVDIIHDDKLLLYIFADQIETKLSYKTNKADLLSWFKMRPPISPEAQVLFYDAMLQTGQDNSNISEIRSNIAQIWSNTIFSTEMEEYLLSRYQFPTICINQKIDYLLLTNKYSGIKSLLALLQARDKFIAKIKLELAQNPQQISLQQRVYAKFLRDDAVNMIYIKYLLQNGHIDAAANRLKVHVPTKHLKLWWKLANLCIREALDAKLYTVAFNIASRYTLYQKMLQDENIVEANWIAGFISLYYLKKYEQSIPYLKKMYETARYALSKSQSSYWLAIAYQKLQNIKQAKYWSDNTKKYGTFYSYIASICSVSDNQNIATKAVSGVISNKFTDNTGIIENNLADNVLNNTVKQAVLLLQFLYKEGYKSIYIEKICDFLVHSNLTLNQYQSIAVDLIKSGWLALAVKLSNALMRFEKGFLRVSYNNNNQFKIPDIAQHSHFLYLSVMRQESAFDINAISIAKARGLMQLMPQTAHRVATKLKLPFDAYITNVDANIASGTYYIDELVSRFDNYVLAIASYNAGENNIKKWIKVRQYPQTRKNIENIVAWIERIPFKETRLYVKKVLENLWTYEVLYSTLDNNKIINYLLK